MGETAGPATLADMGGWPAVLRRLVGGDALTAGEARAAMTDVLDGAATPSQLAAFIVALRMKGETVEEMTGLVGAMLDAAETVPLHRNDAVDTCGTGGAASRRTSAFNVSTIASMVIAGAGGAVCKHGNRKASSTSGSADLLEALGVVIDLDGPGVAACVAETGMGFCFAPRFHPAMRHAVPTRREIGIPTVFNFLGPLANPARLRRQVLGVSDARMGERMAGVLQARGCERALVVHGHDGLDELTTTGPSTVFDVDGGEVRTYVVEPGELGVPVAAPDDLKGGDVATNAELARRILAGEPGAHRELVVLNAAAGLVAGGAAADLVAGVAAARAALDEGRAASVLHALVETSQRVARDRSG